MNPKKDEYMRGYSDGFKDGAADLLVALKAAAQRANETGNDVLSWQETIHAVHRILADAISKADLPAAEGCVLVPIKPTVAMLKAAGEERVRIRHDHEDEAIGGDYWRVMVRAAIATAS